MNTEFIDAKQVAELADLSLNTVYHYKQFGRMPEPKTTFGRTPVWDKAEIVDWVTAKKLRNANTNPKEITHE